MPLLNVTWGQGGRSSKLQPFGSRQPLCHLVPIIVNPPGRCLFGRHPVFDHHHHFTHVLGGPGEIIQEFVEHRVVLFQAFPDNCMDIFRLPKTPPGIIQVFQVPAGKLPVGGPACHHDPLFVIDGPLQRGGHGGIAAVKEFKILLQTIFSHGLIRSPHQTGTRVNTNDPVAEFIGYLVHFLDGINLHIGGHNPTNFCSLQVWP